MKLMRWALVLACLVAALPVQAGTLDRLREGEPLRIGYRADAVPFSFKDSVGEPAGYTVELCRAVAADLKAQLGLPEVKLAYVEVTAEDRFDKITGGEIDLLCGATTVTFGRRETVEFSLPTFVTGAGLLYRADGPQTFADLAGKKIGARLGTTTEQGMREAIARENVGIQIVGVNSHQEGIDKLAANEIQAYFADHAILLFLLAQSPHKDKIKLSSRYLSQEVYALAFAKGDEAFRLAVDRALSRVYRTDLLERIFKAAFGGAEPSPLLLSLYQLNQFQE